MFEKSASFGRLIFKNQHSEGIKMSGLVAWSSRAKRKSIKKSPGSNTNAHRLRANAAKQRKVRASVKKQAERARKEATAKAVAEKNA
jgi:hypothetical protein